MRRLLVLRPEPGAASTLKLARQRGLDAIAVPLFEIDPLSWTPPGPSAFDGLLLTSANAVRCGGERLRGLRALPAYCVGEATASAAREAGFTLAAVGSGGVDELLDSIPCGLRLLHPCGRQRRHPTRPRQQVAAVPIYDARAVEAPDLSPATGSVALIHSPRAGARFASLVLERSSVRIAAISPAAAEAVGGGWESVDIAQEQTDEALLALAARLCNNSPL
jgi:uroporphyrinogen-III synthase